MFKYQVHFQYTPFVKDQGYRGLKNGILTIAASSEAQAIARSKLKCPSGFGHWVNRLATEVI